MPHGCTSGRPTINRKNPMHEKLAEGGQMTARDGFKWELEHDSCGRIGEAGISENDGWSWMNGKRDRTIDKISDGFTVMDPGTNHRQETIINCQKSDVAVKDNLSPAMVNDALRPEGNMTQETTPTPVESPQEPASVPTPQPEPIVPSPEPASAPPEDPTTPAPPPREPDIEKRSL